MSHSDLTHAHPHLLPAYLLEKLANHSDPVISEAAANTVFVDEECHYLHDTDAGLHPMHRQSHGEDTLSAKHLDRTIYSADHALHLPGVLKRGESKPTTDDIAIDEAYDCLGAAFQFYWDVFKRDSIDKQGAALVGTVHYGQSYDNAFWSGEQMVFGDGDGRILNRFTAAMEVVGHALTHGIIQAEADLAYETQSGALRESISDVFGILIKQYRRQETTQDSDWLIGAGLFTSNVNAKALRCMSYPGTAYDDPALGKDPQPAHMKDFVLTYQDNGGVHINSGIANRAFYLFAAALGGFAWERAGWIWYDALCDVRLSRHADFAAFAHLTLTAAQNRYGNPSEEFDALLHAWEQVGVAL